MIYKPVPVVSILESLFATIPIYDGNNKLFFGYGDQKELNTMLLVKQANGEPIYPILWYLLPKDLEGSSISSEGFYDFVLAHNTTLDWFNDQRYLNVFEAILYPHFSLVMQALVKANGISVFNMSSNNKKWTYSEMPNYGNPIDFEGKEEAKQIDFWDAISFRVKLDIKATACDFDKIKYDLINI